MTPRRRPAHRSLVGPAVWLMALAFALSASVVLALPAAAAEVPAPPPPPVDASPRPGPPRRTERPVAEATARGNQALAAGDAAAARQAHAEAQVLAPEVPEAGYNLGVSSLAQGDLEEAARALELAGRLAEQGQGAGADSAEKALLERVRRDAAYNLAHVALANEELERAADLLAGLVGSGPEDEAARRNLELILRLTNAPPPPPQPEPQPQPPSDEDQDPDQESEAAPEGGGGETPEDSPPEAPDEAPPDDGDEQEQPPPQAPEERPGELTREMAERLLDSVAEEEARAQQEEQERRRAEALPPPGGRDW